MLLMKVLPQAPVTARQSQAVPLKKASNQGFLLEPHLGSPPATAATVSCATMLLATGQMAATVPASTLALNQKTLKPGAAEH